MTGSFTRRYGSRSTRDQLVGAFFGPVLRALTQLHAGVIVAVHDEYFEMESFERARPRLPLPAACSRAVSGAACRVHHRGHIPNVRWPPRANGLASGGYRPVEIHADQVGSGRDLELGEHLPEVVVDRARTQEELLRDTGICHPVRDETRDLQLPRREFVPF